MDFVPVIPKIYRFRECEQERDKSECKITGPIFLNISGPVVEVAQN